MGDAPSRKELEAADCWFPALDKVANRPEVTAFKQSSRLHQAEWREKRGHPMGHLSKAEGRRPMGSRLEEAFAYESGATFTSKTALAAARHRLGRPEPGEPRPSSDLWCDLLAPAPMAYNLLGDLWLDKTRATAVVDDCWPSAGGQVEDVRFGWSPGRGPRHGHDHLRDRTAFDAALVLGSTAGRGVVAVAAKYHDHASKGVKKLTKAGRRKQAWLRTKAEASGRFQDGWEPAVLGSSAQPLWLQHLLLLSLLDHPAREWRWGTLVLVVPAGNPGFDRAVEHYRANVLRDRDDPTFEVRTVESLLTAGVLKEPNELAFRERYLAVG